MWRYRIVDRWQPRYILPTYRPSVWCPAPSMACLELHPTPFPKAAHLDAVGEGCASETASRNGNSQSKRLVACSDKLRDDPLDI